MHLITVLYWMPNVVPTTIQPDIFELTSSVILDGFAPFVFLHNVFNHAHGFGYLKNTSIEVFISKTC